MMCFYYDESPTVYAESVRKARKPHRCSGCQRPIAAGSLYTYSHGVFEGHGFSEKFCGACELDRFRIHLTEIAEGCDWSESWADMTDHDGGLQEWMESHDFERSSDADGQKWLARKMTKGHAA